MLAAGRRPWPHHLPGDALHEVPPPQPAESLRDGEHRLGAADGREPETALTGAILTAAEVNETGDLIAWAAAAPPSQLATLAPVVLAVADSGDLRANALLSLAVEELALHVRALARQLFGEERASLQVAMSGGMLSRGSAIRKRLEHRLKSAVPGAQIRSEPVVPARGAVRAALRIVGEAMV